MILPDANLLMTDMLAISSPASGASRKPRGAVPDLGCVMFALMMYLAPFVEVQDDHLIGRSTAGALRVDAVPEVNPELAWMDEISVYTSVRVRPNTPAQLTVDCSPAALLPFLCWDRETQIVPVSPSACTGSTINAAASCRMPLRI